MKFVKEDFKLIQDAAKRRNDRSLGRISDDLVSKILELDNTESIFKKNIKHLSTEDKIKQERILKEDLNNLKTFTDWQNLNNIKMIFYNTLPDKINSKWIVNNYINGNINRVEDIESRLKPAVEEFISLQKDGLVDKTLKIESLEGLKGLETFLEKYQHNNEGKTKKRKTDKSDLDLVFEGKTIKIYHPKTQEAACYIGQGTKWCTASTKGKNMFDHYNKEGPLYVIQPIKGRDREKYQIHFEMKQFMNEQDEIEDLDKFVETFPEMIIAFPKLADQNYREFFTPSGVIKFVIRNWDMFPNNTLYFYIQDGMEGNSVSMSGPISDLESTEHIEDMLVVTGNMTKEVKEMLIDLVIKKEKEGYPIEDIEDNIRENPLFIRVAKELGY